MVLVDVNVLLYAVNEGAPQHARARQWVEGALAGSESIGFAWLVLLAFVRIATLPALFPRPLSCSGACDVVDDWLQAGSAVVVEPTVRHARVLRGLLEETGTGGNLVSDAHLAALALEHGARLCTFDRDFARFPGLKAFPPA